MKKLCALTVLLITTITASAFDFEVDGFYYNITDATNHEVEVTYGKSMMDAVYSGECIIPAVVTYNDTQYSVTAIGDNAFLGCGALTSISIPNSVTSIGSSAFFYCSALTSVTIPNSVTSIGSSAFSYCSALTSVTIPNSVTSIGSGAFNGCSALTAIIVEADNPHYCSSEGVLFNKDMTLLLRVPEGINIQNYTIPNSVTAIGKYAFSGCESLLSVTIPNSVTSIDFDAFANCIALRSISIPNSVKSIHHEVFENCSALTSITIPNSVTSIGYNVFDGCSALAAITVDTGNPIYCSSEGVLFNKDMTLLFRVPEGINIQNYIIPNSVTEILGHAFRGCTSLTSVIIPESVVNIGAQMFFNCTSLQSVNIPNAFSIGAQMFSGCSALKSITLPNAMFINYRAFENCTALEYISVGSDLREIHEGAFKGCTNLKSFFVHSLEPPVCEDWALYNIDKSKCILYVPEGSIDAYKAAPQWCEFTTILAEGTSGIDDVSDGGVDYSAPVEVYNLNGVKIADTLAGLPSGLYIVRQGSKVLKVTIK